MKDDNKTKKQLIHELTELRSQNDTLKKSDNAEKYRSLVENIREVIYELDSQGVVLYISPSIRDMLGYDSAEVVGKSFIELSHKDDRSSLEEWFSELRKGREYPSEYRVINKSGDLRWTRTKTKPIMEDGQFKGAQGILIDVTEQKRAEEALRESEKKYRLVVDNMVDVITAMDMNLHFTYVSPSIMRMRGFTVEEAMAQTLEQVLTPESMQIIAKFFEEEMKLEAGGAADPGRSRILDLEEYRKDGSIVWIENHLSFMRDETQKPVGIISLSRGISERKQAEEKLRESEKKYRELYDFLPIPIYEMDLEANIISANRAIFETFGGTEEDLKKGFKVWRIISPEEIDKVNKNMQRLLNGEPTGGAEYTLMRLDGSVFPAFILSSAIYSNGKPVGLRGAVVDITERRKQEEEALREREELYKTLFDEALDGICLADAETGIIIDCNQALAALVCRERAELIGRPQMILHPPQDDKAAVSPTFKQHLTDKQWQIIETQVVTRTGDIREVEIKANPLYLQGRNLLQGIFRDITERKRAEEALVFNNIILRTQQESSIDGILVVDEKGKILSFNQRFVDLWGIPPDMIESKSDERALQSVVEKLANPEEFIRKVKHLYEVQG